MTAGLDFGRALFAPAAFRVTVAAFKARGLRTVEPVGFVRTVRPLVAGRSSPQPCPSRPARPDATWCHRPLVPMGRHWLARPSSERRGRWCATCSPTRQQRQGPSPRCAVLSPAWADDRVLRGRPVVGHGARRRTGRGRCRPRRSSRRPPGSPDPSPGRGGGRRALAQVRRSRAGLATRPGRSARPPPRSRRTSSLDRGAGGVGADRQRARRRDQPPVPGPASQLPRARTRAHRGLSPLRCG